MEVCAMIEGQEGVNWDEWTALADACEHVGLDGLFRSDHYLSVVDRRERQSLDAWTTIAALAERTTTLRLGTLVSPVTFRHPSVLAKTVATVDHISGGRVELGLGAGWNEGEHEAYGFPFPDLGERMEMLAEQLEVVHRQWTEEAVTFSGRHYRTEECTAEPKPLQRPHPPIIVGGQAGPRSIALAVRFADEYNTLLASVDDCRERKARLVQACARADRDPGTLSLSLMATCVVGTDRAEVVERTRRVLDAWGAADQDAEHVLAERAPRWIAGTPDEVIDRLRELEAAGVERVYLQHLGHADVAMLELVGVEVVPALSA